ncbi:TonB-dependent receptor [Hymenobacter sp. BT188]|uniref:SusC/RagA family TonB-linked outer membrane protein n=1 Tax=Hymenobacter sp. BT188 TaxID=2763504 RepID=UPI0016514FAD|nr:TonB-dependent receptor [Hymenobacter sp. BT188]MBC6607604.1 TonB-dependent receptor [Hymenobacter sp. BT188]
MLQLYNSVRWLPLTVLVGLAPASVFAQTDQTVTGRVVTATDKSGLPGVTVVVKGTTTGTSTNPDGSFTLTAPAGATLTISSIGYVTQEVPASASPINVALAEDVTQLADVVVVGYGTQKKSDVTGALSSVSEEKIKQVPVQNLTQALQGRAAGVDVAGGNFRPGETPAIRIRGNRSVRASNEPLYVVDGIPLAQGTGLNDFNPDDIESVEVLKDASATAIYGSRGANGVVIVTTKRGKEGKFNISYNTYGSFDRPLRLPELFDAAEFADVRREAYRTSGSYTTPYPNPVNDFTYFGTDPNVWANIAGAYTWRDFDARIPETREATEEEKARYALYGFPNVTQIPIYDPSKIRSFDWQDAALRSAFTQNHQLSASGGSENLRASLSVGYLNQEGIQPGQDFTRYTARATFDFKVNKIISVGGSTNASLGIQNVGPDIYGKAVGQLPYATPYNAEGVFQTNPGADANILNPLLDPENTFSERRVARFFTSLYAEARLLEGLRYRLNVGPDFRNARNGQFRSARSTGQGGGANAVSFAQYDQNQNFTYVVENLLFYDKQLTSDHSLGVTLLQSIQQDRSEGSSISATNLPYDSQKWYNLGSTNNAAAQSFGSGPFIQRQLMSWMGRVNYSFRDKYVLTATGRADGASVLAEGRKWAFFPSVALAWKLQEEGFFKDIAMISELKLRGGYGSVGQASVDPYTTGGTLQQTPYVWDETPAYGYTPTPGTLPGTLGGLPNSELEWERTNTVNVGLDFGLFKNRINGSVEVYRANTTGLLLPRALPTASGFNNVLQNIGATRNTGVEATVSTVNVETSKFRWGSDFVFTKNKEEFVELASGKQDDLGNRWFIGEPLGVYYDYKFDGIWQSYDTEGLTRYNVRPGTIKVVDVNNDGQITTLDQIVLGSNRPKWSGSVSNSFSYGGFDLSFLVYARVGQMLATGFRPGLGGRFPGQKVDYWTPANPTTEAPRPNSQQDIATFGDALRYQDGSFAKVRSISLTYNLPKELADKFYSSNLSVYVNAVNPFLITKFKGLDPEATDIGTTSGELAQARNLSTKSLVLGLRIGF